MLARGKTSGSYRPPPPALRIAIRLLACLAASVSGYLTWASVSNGRVIGCSGGGIFDCDHVLNSRWAVWLNLPTALPGVAVYVGIFAASLFIAPRRLKRQQRRAWHVLVLLALLAAGSAVWFSALQLFAIRGFCFYCATVHVCGLLLAGIILFRAPIDLSRRRRRQPVHGVVIPRPAAIRCAVIGTAALATLVVGQLLVEPAGYTLTEFEPIHGSLADIVRVPPASAIGASIDGDRKAAAPPTSPAPDFARSRSFVGGRILIGPDEFPILGRPDAPAVVAKLFDYTCSHCRVLHMQLEQARQRYGRQLAIMVLPVPMNSRCNTLIRRTHPRHRDACELARLALAVWSADRAAFATFHGWLFQDATPPPLALAAQRAAELVGHETINEALRDPDISRQLRQGVKIYGKLGRGTIPKLLFERQVLNSAPPRADVLFTLLENSLGIAPRSATDAVESDQRSSP